MWVLLQALLISFKTPRAHSVGLDLEVLAIVAPLFLGVRAQSASSLGCDALCQASPIVISNIAEASKVAFLRCDQRFRAVAPKRHIRRLRGTWPCEDASAQISELCPRVASCAVFRSSISSAQGNDLSCRTTARATEGNICNYS